MRRALEVLEYIGTPGARQLLRRLAKGHRVALVTQEAKAAGVRLNRRPAAKP
jgi:hypothetical protein